MVQRDGLENKTFMEVTVNGDTHRRLLNQLDPLYRLTLAAGQQAWRDAVTEGLDRTRVGVALAAIALPTDASSAITRETLGKSFEWRLLNPNCDTEGACRAIAPAQATESVHPLNAQVTALPGSLLASALEHCVPVATQLAAA